MEFTSFTTLVREEVEKRAGESYKVRINDVRKNNGVILRGLTVMQDDSNISPRSISITIMKHMKTARQLWSM